MRICPTCYGLYGPEQLRCPKDNTPTEDSVEVLIGKSLGSYQVRALIGEGGMGVVYAGEHTTIGRRVALKVLRPELSLRDDIVERFVQEARAVNTISHGNIVNIYDFGRTPFGTFYIVMEYLDGKTVRTMLDEEGAQPLEVVRTVVTGVGAALAAAHSKGFIHRDVKPENIMLYDQAGTTRIKLLDFGIAKLLRPGGPATTHTGSTLGTPQYMSPEQLEDIGFDHRADIYSLGAVVYEMLTGRVPYPGKTHAEVRQLQVTQTPAPPSVVRPDAGYSRRLDAAVLWALSTDPSARCSRMEDLVDHFQAGFDAPPDAPLPQTQTATRRAGLGLVLVVALVAMALGGVIVYLALPDRRAAGAADAGADIRPAAQLSLAQARKLALDRVKQALASSDTNERVLVTEVMEQMHRPMVAVRDELRRALAGDPQPSVRINAALLLGRMKDKESADPLRRLLDRPTTQGQTAWRYAEALALMGDPHGSRRLRRELQRAPEAHRRPLLKILGRLADPAARAGLKQMLEQLVGIRDEKINLRGLLAAMGDKEAQEQLRDVARNDEWPIRVKAATALAVVDRETAQDVLRQAVTQVTGENRLTAASQLAFFRDATAAKVLVEFVESQQKSQRKESLVALGHIHTALAHATLIRALDDESPEVALAAAVALLPME